MEEVQLGAGRQFVAVIGAVKLLALGCATAFALMPLARPEPYSDLDPGNPASLAGSWAISIPTMEVGIPDRLLAGCKLPVRIQAADEGHIIYLRPREAASGAALALQEQDGGAMWVPIDDGPSFFAFWVSRDQFYLYDNVPQTEADWGRPYVYRRCSDSE
jgi:hypothetical protein